MIACPVHCCYLVSSEFRIPPFPDTKSTFFLVFLVGDISYISRITLASLLWPPSSCSQLFKTMLCNTEESVSAKATEQIRRITKITTYGSQDTIFPFMRPKFLWLSSLFFYYLTDGKLRYGEIMWITPFHIANLEIWELRTHLLSLEFSSRRIFRFQSHFQGFTQYCFSLALTFKPFHCSQTLSPYLGFSSKVTLLSVWKFSGGSISPTGCQTLTHKGLAHDLFGLLL